DGVTRAVAPTTKAFAALALLTATLALGVGVLAQPAPAPQNRPAEAPQLPPPEPPRAKVDLHGDPLPPGAVARLGTTAFRHLDTTVDCLAYSPDGKLLATAGYDGWVRVWEAATGREVRRFGRGLVYFDYCLKFSPDGKKLGVAWGGGRINFYDLATGKADT